MSADEPLVPTTAPDEAFKRLMLPVLRAQMGEFRLIVDPVDRATLVCCPRGNCDWSDEPETLQNAIDAAAAHLADHWCGAL